MRFSAGGMKWETCLALNMIDAIDKAEKTDEFWLTSISSDDSARDDITEALPLLSESVIALVAPKLLGFNRK